MNPMLMRRLRQIHQYIGLFFAPAILFFAFSGGLQTFGLHENRYGGPYKPPAWIVTIASIHKDQELPHRRPADADDDHGGPDAADKAAPGKSGPGKSGPDKGGPAKADHGPGHAPEKPNYASGPLKIFVGALAVGLILSTLIGVWLGLANRSARTGSLIALGLGLVLPLALIAMAGSG